MTRRLIIVGVGVVLIAAAAYLVYARKTADSTADGVADLTGSPRVLLNEILFQPASGSTFVELWNASGDAARLDGYSLVNQANVQYALPPGSILPAGGFLLIRFDGGTQVEGSLLHAQPSDFLHRDNGSIRLVAAESTQDEAFWSTTGNRSFGLGRGGRIPQLEPGTTLGRPPASVGLGPGAWTVFYPSEQTPGAANPVPAVVGLTPMSGAVLSSVTPTLRWYAVPTATRYQVQVAEDASFTSPILDRIVTGTSIAVPAMAEGRYQWRVRALIGEQPATSATFSRSASLVISNAVRRRADRRVPRRWISRFVEPLHAAQETTPELYQDLGVPFIAQRKDTALLSLEADEDGNKPWDRAWGEGERAGYCGRATVAMIAAKFGGKLSQDRISYEAHKDRSPGPELDIDPRNVTSSGFYDEDFMTAMTFALGAAPTPREISATSTPQQYWDLIRSEIDDGFPVLATSFVHAWVIAGYSQTEDGRFLFVNDPAHDGPYYIDLLTMFGAHEEALAAKTDSRGSGTTAEDAQKFRDFRDSYYNRVPTMDGGLFTHFLVPRNARGETDEPEVSLDSDLDGVMDFDETRRFMTDPHATDTDRDGVDDKKEVSAWVFDEKYGYWPAMMATNADRDGDGKRMELDEDSDAGGCIDGLEDHNNNGKHEASVKESYNFEPDDDGCITGTFEHLFDTVQQPGPNVNYFRQSAAISLQPQPDGTLKGVVIFDVEGRNTLRDPNTGCIAAIEGEPTTWRAEFTAVSQALPGGRLKITMQPSGETPPYPARWRNECNGVTTGVTSLPVQGWLWPEVILTNGVYDETIVTPLVAGETGTKTTRLRFEQKRPSPP